MYKTVQRFSCLGWRKALLEVEPRMLKKCTPLWREANFLKSKMYKTHQRSDGFWKLRCGKSAHRCGAKHILIKNAKITTRSGHFWNCRCRKSARLFWREAPLEVKNATISTWVSDHFLTIRWSFDVEKVHAVVARSTFPSQKCQKLGVLSDF